MTSSNEGRPSLLPVYPASFIRGAWQIGMSALLPPCGFWSFWPQSTAGVAFHNGHQGDWAMSNDAAKLFDEVCQYARRTAVLASINETLGWDERTHLPPAGGDYRAEQSTLLAGLIHQRWVDPKFGEQLDELAGELKGTATRADLAVVVRRLKRQRDKKVKLPQTLVEELARTAVLGQQAWQEAREERRLRVVSPLVGADLRVEASTGRGAGLSAMPLRRPVGRLRA